MPLERGREGGVGKRGQAGSAVRFANAFGAALFLAAAYLRASQLEPSPLLRFSHRNGGKKRSLRPQPQKTLPHRAVNQIFKGGRFRSPLRLSKNLNLQRKHCSLLCKPAYAGHDPARLPLCGAGGKRRVSRIRTHASSARVRRTGNEKKF